MIAIYAVHRTSTNCTDADIAAVVEAVSTQLDEHFAADYDCEPPQVIVWDGNTTLPDGALRTDFCDLADDQEPGALAWHTEESDPVTRKPRPVLKIPVNRILAQPNASILSGTASLSAVFSHEALEAKLDSSCGDWSDVGDGKTELAKECADPVQQFCYDVALADGRKASVSAYVLVAYWDSMTPDDATGATLARGVPSGCLTKHHQIADSAFGANDQAGGYGMFRSVGGEQQVGGERVIEIRGNSPVAERARKMLAEGRGRVGKRKAA